MYSTSMFFFFGILIRYKEKPAINIKIGTHIYDIINWTL